MIESAAHTTDSRCRGGSSSALRSAIDTITPTSSAGTITTLPMIRSENAEPAAMTTASTIRTARSPRIARG